MFVGREAELSFLEDRYRCRSGQLIVLYGRRRVGKTETLRQFCKDKPCVFFSCRECTDPLQLAAFSQKMFEYEIPAKKFIPSFVDWEQAFRSIPDLPFGERKRLVIIDEFPYMCSGNKSIPSILQMLWDEYLKDENVMIILCGSSMSFIEKELLAEKNPLYGRATGIYRMNEMSFYDAMRFFPNYSDTDKITVYAVLGGIPHYLTQFDPEISPGENIRRNILTKGSVLYSEVEFLLHQELRETALYNSLIESIAVGNTKLNEIDSMSQIHSTAKTGVYLRHLIELGLVEREISVNAGAKETANNSRGIYRLTDNFFRFWYSFVFSNHSDLESGDADGVYRYSVEPNLDRFASVAFEQVCRQFVREQQKRNALPFRYSRMGKWFGKTTVRDDRDHISIRETEIDLLAVSADKRNYLVGECKYKNSPFLYRDYLNAAAKLGPEQEHAAFSYAFFSRSGFDEKLLRAASENAGIRLYSLAEIVNL